ncbi:hypothetical protein M422DRAFT_50033 [Sphaerobolus stellatus SS14]|uniref:C2H2-type domain-containing protein n=1 Tax=Sphaerobolus stellatus (strain SS14) TaxID=990650 RepID=A0A0C9VL40_SPHS4|nr:hypothetical protein M422DRAFT_50033 [Sphaerobolus stellatus SS14]
MAPGTYPCVSCSAPLEVNDSLCQHCALHALSFLSVTPTLPLSQGSTPAVSYNSADLSPSSSFTGSPADSFTDSPASMSFSGSPTSSNFASPSVSPTSTSFDSPDSDFPSPLTPDAHNTFTPGSSPDPQSVYLSQDIYFPPVDAYNLGMGMPNASFKLDPAPSATPLQPQASFNDLSYDFDFNAPLEAQPSFAALGASRERFLMDLNAGFEAQAFTADTIGHDAWMNQFLNVPGLDAPSL